MSGSKYMIRNRREGKTGSVLAWLRMNPGGTIITANAEMVRDLVKRYQDMFGTPPPATANIITARQADHKLVGRKGPVAIDNLDLILGDLLHAYGIDFITATGEFHY